MEFSEVVKQRHSVRAFEQRPVEDEKIRYVLDCARHAPSWVNKQCWRFVVVRDPTTIAAISRTHIINRWLAKAPVLVVACADPTESGSREDIPFFCIDIANAFEHFHLAATDVGLGSCWIGGFDEGKVKTLLEIPPRIRVVALSPLGYPAQTTAFGKLASTVTRSSHRKSLEEIVHYDRW